MKKIISMVLVLVMVVTALPSVNIKSHAAVFDDYWEYRIIDENKKTARITRYLGSESSVEVPITVGYGYNNYGEWFSGYTVTEIGNSAFRNNKNITSLVTFSELCSIGDYAFAGCTSLEWSSQIYGNIGEGAFKGCTSLSNCPIKSAVNIGNFAFEGCTSLTTVYLPSTVKNIGDGAFKGCTNLTCFETNGGTYESHNGLLYKTLSVDNYGIAEYELACCPAGNTDTNIIRYNNASEGPYKNVRNIQNYAFADCIHIKSITINPPIVEIGDYAFYNCSSLENIYIANSVNVIGTDILNGCNRYTLSCNCGTVCADYAQGNNRLRLSHLNLEHIKTEPSCDTIGEEYDWCSRCKGKINYKTTPALGHRYDDGVITKEATCTEKGEKTYTCARCGGTYVEYIEKIPHSYDDGVITKEATCTEKGEKTYTCARCYDYYTETIPALGHEFTNYVSNNDATCTKDGTKTAVCNHRCGATNTIVDVGSALGHSYNAGVVTTQPTCTKVGRKTFTCTVCGDEYIQDLQELEHSYDEDNVCKACGFSPNLTEYEILNNGTIRITDFNNSKVENMVIPSHIDGYLVTAIDGRAFNNCSLLKTITIPESVSSIGTAFLRSETSCKLLEKIIVDQDNTTYKSVNGVLYYVGQSHFIKSPMLLWYPANKSGKVDILEGTQEIGEYAFSGCIKPSSIVVPNSVTKIGGYAFNGCTSLKSISLPNSLTSIGSYVFMDCTGLESIDLPNGIESIYDMAFWNCSSLSTISIPNSVTHIGKTAFCGCSSLKSITIPNSVTSIGSGAFANCTSLKNVHLSSIIKTIDSHMFNCCSSLETIEIPNGVTNIGNMAFNKCVLLKNIVIPDSVTFIGNETFRDCTSLKTIQIPNNVIDIGEKAFCNCKSLESISIPKGVTQIRSETFRDCTSLKNIDIPDSVTAIENHSFLSCIKLVITCACNSYALDYAKKNKIAFEVLHDYEDVIVAATCTADGTKTYICSTCGDSYTENIPAFGHSYNNGVITTNPTCTATGTKTYTCSTCGDTYEETVPALGHSYNSNGICTRCSDWKYKTSTPKLVSVTNTTAGITIKWNALTGAEGYYVYRKTGSDSWKRIATVTNALSYTDTKATAGTKYTYTVKAYNGSTNSKYDTTGLTTIRLVNPAVKTANAAAGINVTWGKVAGAKGYYVYRKTAGGSYARIGSTTSTSYVDKTAKAGTTYAYTVRAYNGTVLSSYKGTNVVRLTNPTFTLAKVSNGIKITTTKVTGAKGYYIYRKTGSGSYKKIATTTSLSYVDKTAKKNVKYTYAVKAYNGSYTSAYTGKAITVKK